MFQLTIILFLEPPTPKNVQLTFKKSENLNPNPTLLVLWNIPHSFAIFQYEISFISKTGISICQTLITEEIVHTTTLKYKATAPECPLNASTLYNATVQILTVNSNNQSYERGNRSLPSNFQETGNIVLIFLS